MRLSRTSAVFLALFAVYILIRLWGGSIFSGDRVSTEAVLGKVSDLSYVTFYSTKPPARSNHPEGWWSVAENTKNEYLVVPGKIPHSPGTLVFSNREGVILVGVSAKDWYFSGLLEGYVLSQGIRDTLTSVEKYYEKVSKAWTQLRGQQLASFAELKDFVHSQTKLLETNSELHNLTLSNVLVHLEGIVEGCNLRYRNHQVDKKKPIPQLTLADLFLINSVPELLDMGAYIKKQHIDLSPTSNTALARELGNSLYMVTSLLLSGRYGASFIQATSGNLEGKASWETNHWQPMPELPRIFARISISSSPGGAYGYQYVGFPGQIISTDSFSMSLSANKKLIALLMRQADFSSPATSPPTATLSAWMTVAAVLHQSNATYNEFVNAWSSSWSQLVSPGWKAIAVYDQRIHEIETHYDAFLLADRNNVLDDRKHYLTTSTMTLLRDNALEKHGWLQRQVGFKNDAVQSTKFDGWQHASIDRMNGQAEVDSRRILAGASQPAVEQAQRVLEDRFGIYLSQKAEYVDISAK